MAVLHSNRTQVERVEALEGFKNGRYEVMVATDIAARGIDIAGVSHVINYDVPQHPEDYVHRIGRTGRAQNVGDAFTIMTAEELPHVKEIEHFMAQKVPRLKLQNFSYVYSAVFDEQRAQAALRNAKGVRTHRGVSFGVRRRRRSTSDRWRTHTPPQLCVGNIRKNFVVARASDSPQFFGPEYLRRALLRNLPG